MGHWEILAAVFGLLKVGIPVAILYAAILAIRRLFRQLNEIQTELREIRSRLPDGDRNPPRT